jgi:hypothetical protein
MKHLTFILFLFYFNNGLCQLSLPCIPEKNNFIYAGIENEITINGFNQISNPTVTVTWGTLKKVSDSTFLITPMNVDSCFIFIRSALNSQSVFSIKVKQLPKPDPFLNGNVQSGVLDRDIIKHIDSLLLAINDFDRVVPFEIISFDVTRVWDQAKSTISNSGSKLGSRAKKMLTTATSGDIYIFDNISYSVNGQKQKLSRNVVLRIR